MSHPPPYLSTPNILFQDYNYIAYKYIKSIRNLWDLRFDVIYNANLFLIIINLECNIKC